MGGLVVVSRAQPARAQAPQEQVFDRQRERMVEEQLIQSPDGRPPITDERVLAAMRRVPRHRFVPSEVKALAYQDGALPIGEGQTISQPYIVALMTEAARVEAGETILEIGTGSGYQAAVLAQLAREVYTIEILEPLARRAEATLRELGVSNVHVRTGDGFFGWPEAAPFDAILVTASAPRVPQALIDQLALNGRLVIPEGDGLQELVVYTRTAEGLARQRSIPVRFVPMIGRVREPQPNASTPSP
ncbi:MAG: protein-L-isoaspartate(D-aspartate) O-methyltransferase [Candidatus Omnitrophica bacterium]|nr:protein-L-isoaspartate(D-aspartate) O-methyltransferase [Candidatus Omnitrophota bacterium]